MPIGGEIVLRGTKMEVVPPVMQMGLSRREGNGELLCRLRSPG